MRFMLELPRLSSHLLTGVFFLFFFSTFFPSVGDSGFAGLLGLGKVGVLIKSKSCWYFWQSFQTSLFCKEMLVLEHGVIRRKDPSFWHLGFYSSFPCGIAYVHIIFLVTGSKRVGIFCRAHLKRAMSYAYTHHYTIHIVLHIISIPDYRLETESHTHFRQSAHIHYKLIIIFRCSQSAIGKCIKHNQILWCRQVYPMFTRNLVIREFSTWPPQLNFKLSLKAHQAPAEKSSALSQRLKDMEWMQNQTLGVYSPSWPETS